MRKALVAAAVAALSLASCGGGSSDGARFDPGSGSPGSSRPGWPLDVPGGGSSHPGSAGGGDHAQGSKPGRGDGGENGLGFDSGSSAGSRPSSSNSTGSGDAPPPDPFAWPDDSLPPAVVFGAQSAYRVAAAKNEGGGKGRLVSIVDSGVADLAKGPIEPKMHDIYGREGNYRLKDLPKFSMLGGNDDASDPSDHRHGTFVAMLARKNAPNALLRSVDYLGSDPRGENKKLTVESLSLYVAKDDGARVPAANVYNLSLGLGVGRGEASALEARNFKKAVDRGSILVVAAGNDRSGALDPLAAMPEALSGQEKQDFLDGFVVAVDIERSAKDYRPDSRGRDFIVPVGHCGQMMFHCVAADGAAIYRAGAMSYRTFGTSNSAPIVSGVLASVGSRFPWMSNKQLLRVVFGTAKDLGPKGVDERYGWGAVDRDKALRGYGRFDWGMETFHVPKGRRAYFDNDIGGSGGFAKRGLGALALNGDNSFTGLASVESGVLAVNGPNVAPFAVGRLGVLAAGDDPRSSVGSLKNDGTVRVWRAPLTVAGMYEQGPGGVLEAKLGAKIKTKEARLAGRLLAQGGSYLSAAPQDYVVLESESPISGAFDSYGGTGLAEALSLRSDGRTVSVRAKRGSVAKALSQSAAIEAVESGRGGRSRIDSGARSDAEFLDARLAAFDAKYEAGVLTEGERSAAAQAMSDVETLGPRAASALRSPSALMALPFLEAESSSRRARSALGKALDFRSSVWAVGEKEGGRNDRKSSAGDVDILVGGAGASWSSGRFSAAIEASGRLTDWEDDGDEATAGAGLGAESSASLRIGRKASTKAAGLSGAVAIRAGGGFEAGAFGSFDGLEADAKRFYGSTGLKADGIAATGGVFVARNHDWLGGRLRFRPLAAASYSRAAFDKASANGVAVEKNEYSAYSVAVKADLTFAAAEALRLGGSLGVVRRFSEDRSLKASLAGREGEYEFASGAEYPKTRAVAEMRADWDVAPSATLSAQGGVELADGLDRFAAQIGFRWFF